MSRSLTSMGRSAVALAAALIAGAAPVAGPHPVVAAAAPASEAVRIMPLGDSITWGKGSRTDASYRVDLRTRLTGAGLATDFVGSVSTGIRGADRNHEGHPGWTIAQITARIDGWLATSRPDVVLLHIGTNDLKSAGPAPGAAARLIVLIDKIRAGAPGAHIFVAKITGSTNPRAQTRIDAYNAAIPAVVARRGPLVHLVDQSTVRGLDLRDSVHPNDFGYAKMAHNWYRAMRLVLRPPGQVWPLGVSPYLATRAYLCINSSRPVCRWWTLRGGREKQTVPARTRTVKRWSAQP